LLQQVAGYGKPILLSTGLARSEQIHAAKKVILESADRHGVRSPVAVLHCITAYPATSRQANLGAISALKDEFGGTIGYSDHTLGHEAALLSVAQGARIVEKHFTLDKNYSDFRDHAMSADPGEMKDLVDAVRRAEEMMGDGCIDPRPEEVEVEPQLRRSIAAKHTLPKGVILTADDITWVRPGTGIAAGKEATVIGKMTTRAIETGRLITEDDLKTVDAAAAVVENR
jgi:N-acetylneuraminate synthase/N,N'-diacetyllegionaminate synthase